MLLRTLNGASIKSAASSAGFTVRLTMMSVFNCSVFTASSWRPGSA